MDGPEHPDCMDDGRFNRKQCLSFTGSCWCVDPDTGAMIEGTMKARQEDDVECEGI